MVTAVSLRGSESLGDEMGEEREAFFDFGGKHLNWGMGASAPIITSKDFNEAKIFNQSSIDPDQKINRDHDRVRKILIKSR